MNGVVERAFPDSLRTFNCLESLVWTQWATSHGRTSGSHEEFRCGAVTAKARMYRHTGSKRVTDRNGALLFMSYMHAGIASIILGSERL